MPIDKIDTIDLVGIEKHTGYIILTISDHLDWDDVYNHLVVMQQKINCYLEFIENGQIYSAYPKSIGRQIIIEVVCKCHIPDEGLTFLEKVKSIVTEMNVGFRWKVLS